MLTIDALKNLAAAVCSVEASAVTGETIPEVIQYIADNYPETTEG